MVQKLRNIKLQLIGWLDYKQERSSCYWSDGCNLHNMGRVTANWDLSCCNSKCFYLVAAKTGDWFSEPLRNGYSKEPHISGQHMSTRENKFFWLENYEGFGRILKKKKSWKTWPWNHKERQEGRKTSTDKLVCGGLDLATDIQIPHNQTTLHVAAPHQWKKAKIHTTFIFMYHSLIGPDSLKIVTIQIHLLLTFISPSYPLFYFLWLSFPILLLFISTQTPLLLYLYSVSVSFPFSLTA